MKRRLNELVIKNLPYSEGPPYDVWCASLPRFGVRVGKTRKTFILNLNKRRLALGVFPYTTLRDARDRAKRALYAKYEPQASLSSHAARDLYLDAIADQKRPNTLSAYSTYLKRLPDRHLHELSPQLLNATLPQGKSAANLCFASYKAFLSWCVEQGHIKENPLLKRRSPNKLKSRDRLLSDDEIRTIWRTSLDHGDAGKVFRALILSGQRISQFQHFDPAWIQGDTIVWPPDRMKSGEQHVLPLTDTLRANIPISTSNNEIAALKAALPIADFRPHDFRRYHSSVAARLRIDLDVEEMILAHKTGSRSAIQRVYDRYDRLEPMRDALQKYEHYLFSTVLTEQSQNLLCQVPRSSVHAQIS